jgi:hypothetical protein
MARLSEELPLAWSSLAIDGDSTPGWRGISISQTGALALRAGRRYPSGHEALMVRFAKTTLPQAQKLPDGCGFTVERASPLADGGVWLALTRSDSGGVDIFSEMACDVAEALGACKADDEPHALRVMLGRVRAWQEFMRKGARSLSAEEEIGLVGELAALITMIGLGVSAVDVIEAWRGPLDGVRDFEIGTGGIEVKTTYAAAGFKARIGSLDQLDDMARQPLYVAGMRLREIAAGQTLPQAVEEARATAQSSVEARRLLDERLLAAGYRDAHADRYSKRFVVDSAKVLHVAEGFPRLTPWNVPKGVTAASYEIDFEQAPGDGLGFEGALRKLGAI